MHLQIWRSHEAQQTPRTLRAINIIVITKPQTKVAFYWLIIAHPPPTHPGNKGGILLVNHSSPPTQGLKVAFYWLIIAHPHPGNKGGILLVNHSSPPTQETKVAFYWLIIAHPPPPPIHPGNQEIKKNYLQKNSFFYLYILLYLF